MARSSTQDPITKFRFRVSVIEVAPSLGGLIGTVAGSLNITGDAVRFTRVLLRVGFSSVTLPRMNINEMLYRENIDGNRFSKHPGLSRYEPIVLKRGVTKSRDLYDWLRLVNEELALLVSAQELAGSEISPTIQNISFRKDMVIEVLDREGKPVKAWYLMNAWPSSYKPGDDLDASSDTTLLEELTISYELFLELEGGLEGLSKELLKNIATKNDIKLPKFGF